MTCTLIVTMDVTTLCENNGYENTNQVNYSTSLNIPLAVDSVNMFRTSASVEGQINNIVVESTPSFPPSLPPFHYWSSKF